MIGIGTIVNVLAIIVGGTIGLFSGTLLNDKIKDGILKANGIAVIILGLSGSLSILINQSDNKTYLMMIISLTVGSLIGGFFGLEDKFIHFGEWLKKKTGNEKEAGFVDAFITASFTVCIGAMAIVGALEDGINHNPSTLFIKAILDFTIIMVMSSSLGKGCIFSAIPVLILQGSITLLATIIAPLLTDIAINNISLVGNILIFCVGINLLKPKTVSVVNMLPSLLIALIWPFF